MIKLTQNTPTAGDCTAGYAVTLDREYTVNDFIDEVLTRNEWGYIGIYKEEQAWFDHGDPACEYKRDKIVSEMPREVLSKTIKSAKAHGGWSNMNYILHI